MAEITISIHFPHRKSGNLRRSSQAADPKKPFEQKTGGRRLQVCWSWTPPKMNESVPQRKGTCLKRKCHVPTIDFQGSMLVFRRSTVDVGIGNNTHTNVLIPTLELQGQPVQYVKVSTVYYRLSHARDVSCDIYIYMFGWVEIIAHNLMTCWCVVHDTLFVTSSNTWMFVPTLRLIKSWHFWQTRRTWHLPFRKKKLRPPKEVHEKTAAWGVNFLDRTFCWSWKAPIFGCLEKHLPCGWRHLTTFDGEKKSVLHACNWQITSPKTNMDTRNDGVEKVDSFRIWPCLVSMLDFWGVYRQTFCVSCVFGNNLSMFFSKIVSALNRQIGKWPVQQVRMHILSKLPWNPIESHSSEILRIYIYIASW